MSARADDDMQVVEDCYMVGRRNPHSLLQCNTYLRTFRGGRGGDLHWCVDPGSQIDYPEVRANLLTHIGSLRELKLFSLNHQDPDVVGNLQHLTEANDSMIGLVSEDTWRLARHMGGRPKTLHYANRLKGNVIKLPEGHRIRTVPTPFCHFRGAIAYYDLETGVLFTGDLFGGLNEPGRMQLLADEEDWPGIAIFHQIYMPSHDALSYAIQQIRALDPPVRMIAPQHGFVLVGAFMHDVMERLENLPVGMDRLPSELDEECMDAYRAVFHEVIDLTTERLGRLEVLRRLRALDEDHELTECIRVATDHVELIAQGIRALPLLVDVLAKDQPEGLRNGLKSVVLRQCQRRDVPLPQITPGVEEMGSDVWIG